MSDDPGGGGADRVRLHPRPVPVAGPATRPRAPVALAVVLAVALLAGPATAAETYRWPVDAPDVAVWFDPGAGRYGAGHRGVDLAVQPGTRVHATAAGRVAYQGVVAGSGWLSIDHPDGVRTSYGPLARVLVPAGSRVAQGQPIAIALGQHAGAPTLHWGARRGEDYIDPTGLVPDPAWLPTLVGPGDWAVTGLPDIPSYGRWDGEHRFGLVPGSPDAEGVGWLLPPNPNHVIVIAGIDSSSGGFPIDLRDLGYPPDAITELSHAGRDPLGAGDPGDPRRDQLPYGPADTYIGIEALARQLRAQLQAHAAAHPGQAVDLVGHSLGGVVAMHYLLTMHDPADPSLPPIGSVATFAAPLEGADTANLADGVVSSLLGEAILGLTGQRDLAASHSTQDLGVGSDLLEALAEAWSAALADRYAGPLATGTRVLTVGASRDGVVTEHRSDLPGAEHVVIPGGHSGSLETEAARIVLREFLAGQQPPGEAGGIGHWVSYPVGAVERGLGYAAPWAEELVGGRLIRPLKGPVLKVGKAVWRRLPVG